MSDTLKDHQAMLAEMLGDFDDVCRRHGIRYALFAGTALGAVRHKGFIPWDDDLDVILLREDYDRLLEVARDAFDQKKYFFQKEHSEHWPMHFSKLRRNGTACIERYIPNDPQVHQGVYVDVFPCDNLSDNPIVARMQFVASKIVIGKCLDKRGYLTDSVLKKAFVVFCRLIPFVPVNSLAKLGRASQTGRVHSFFGASRRYKKAVFPREMFTELTMLSFMGGEYPVSAHWDEMLTTLYGDYMTPQPEEQRGRKVHAVLLDLHRSYEEYVGIQEMMRFDEYTRSMR